MTPVKSTLFAFILVFLTGCETPPTPDLAQQSRIGTNFGGGIIFYIDRTGQHGLIAASSDQGRGSWYEALRLCKEYRGGGYADWFMPSIDQLHMLYQQKDAVGGFSNVYPSDIYWSSTQGSGGAAYNGVWIHDFPDYGGGPKGKIAPASISNNSNSVRAIRAF